MYKEVGWVVGELKRRKKKKKKEKWEKYSRLRVGKWSSALGYSGCTK